MPCVEELQSPETFQLSDAGNVEGGNPLHPTASAGMPVRLDDPTPTNVALTPQNVQRLELHATFHMHAGAGVLLHSGADVAEP
eukprot:113649-Amphidinium_carterae.1